MVSPSTMPVPKSSRYMTGALRNMTVKCGRCGHIMKRLWILTVPKNSRQPCWERLCDGDLCFLCLRATAPYRRAGVFTDAVGWNEREKGQKVPGIDFFPFEAGAGCCLSKQTCALGPVCTNHTPEHHAMWDH